MLKDHFSSDATETIESVFLILKSRCAFVNYRTDLARLDAVSRFHNSNFADTRLVCRNQRDSRVSGNKESPSLSVEEAMEERMNAKELPGKVENGEPNIELVYTDRPKKAKQKFFIMKSLGTGDLQVSVQDGYWVTQAHVQAALNEGFEVKLFLLYRWLDRLMYSRRPKTCTLSSLPISPANSLVMHVCPAELMGNPHSRFQWGQQRIQIRMH